MTPERKSRWPLLVLISSFFSFGLLAQAPQSNSYHDPNLNVGESASPAASEFLCLLERAKRRRRPAPHRFSRRLASGRMGTSDYARHRASACTCGALAP